MPRTQDLDLISTRQRRIAEKAREHRERSFLTLAHHVDLDWLRVAYARTRKDGAPGVDGQTAEAYGKDLDANLASLLERFKSGLYRAPPVRRTHIPKGDDGKSTRPIGIPTIEDKILQRAVAMLLEPIYEQDFLDCSYGFRPGRSAHQGLQSLWEGLTAVGGGTVIELDIRSFYDELDRAHLREFLDLRVRDGVVRRAIGKWLKAGVLEEGRIQRPTKGTPQGGVISPLLANIYLHEVLDVWFEETVRPRLRGRGSLIRFADDAVMVFEREDDAQRVYRALPQRFGRYGLRLHPEKTRLLAFHRPMGRPGEPDGKGPPGGGSRTFTFLGFTHYWGRSRKGKWLVKRKTAATRLARSLRKIGRWCRYHRHQQVAWQQHRLNSMLRGHYAYYGITNNIRALGQMHRQTTRLWKKWLERRSQRGMTWEKFRRLLKRYPLAEPKIYHSYRRAQRTHV